MTAILGHVIEGKSSISFDNPSSSSSELTSDEFRGTHRHRHSGRHGRRPPRPIQNDHSHSHEHGGGGNNRGGENRGCGRGWKRFDRPTGGWCIKVNEGIISNAEAESKCQLEGGTLSGLQDTNEILYITSEALRFFPSGSLWVGARRTAACRSSASSATCNGHTAFAWTDGSATGLAGFQWNYGQPDNAHGRTQQCVVLLASTTPKTTESWFYYANKLDDVGCENLMGQPLRTVRGYVCGKRPNERRRK
ncbi:hypothetical protein CAEBREN_02049 [Caenorhabditis brenneri]|uniref:C-type lectin domain-containing protein n=1 Tax=Caenorhabditis brenneri TaxID=135651 RepID=G0PAS6_CAEBE|nr:hypothetical protein CAEBREN_02049 [Caenorhabditis brenneri]